MAKKTKKVSITYDNLHPGYTFLGKSGKKFEVVETIGIGGMGAVYMAIENESQNKYAVKVEKYEQNPRILQRQGLRIAMEKLTMKSCRSSPYFPKYVDAGRTDRFGWIAMELVGQSLYDLWMNTKYQRFSMPTCLKIAIQVIKALQELHTRGFVHRDLKPDNLAIGVGQKSNTIYILDTGVSRQYKNVSGVPLKPRAKIRFRGSKDYSSLSMHREQECGPRDDLESMFYILALFLTGKLPWSSIVNDIDIILAKHDCKLKPTKLFSGTVLCPILSELWSYNDQLRYEDNVDYEYFIRSLTAVQTRLKCAGDRFDWEMTKLKIG